MHRLELKIPPAVVAALTLALMWGIRELFPRLTLSLPGSRQLAIVLLGAGLALGVLAVHQFRSAGTTTNPHRVRKTSALVVGGVYKISRNPMYLAMLIVLLAGAVRLSNVATLAGLPLYVAFLTRFQIEPEERAMTERFGEPYIRYASQVRRWI